MAEKTFTVSAERRQELHQQLQEFDQFVEQYSDRAKAVGLYGPPQLVGVLNALGMIYRKTLEQGFDIADPDCPLIALPSHLAIMEERVESVLKTIATVRIRTIVENP